MTSMTADVVSSILVSCKQTRFQIETPNYRELDIEGLNVTVTAGPPAGAPSLAAPGKAKAKSKAKGKARAAARNDGVDILSDATLRLKAGQRYALIGRNGTGKSTLLRAIADKLIPGMPEETRVALLQQQADDDSDRRAGGTAADDPANRRTMLEEVIERATAKSVLEQEIQGE
ncbi:hypothetical protein SPI_08707 [Niveomyces insectorum RCEF 264]|uniref:ABC transporter domain-containing protein n=1 Tax=Niveomyces insectorum RCEF 264 TaxID=1081102 RepID=A0A167MWG1_9HYPO|nr:hypothetical protein SPI_08707 [Niveomyces insectorum RCEF 264]